MGLDTVEIVMRCEEVFGITLQDSKRERVQTVGHLHGFICEQMNITAVPLRH
jgi:acyl carrier protein